MAPNAVLGTIPFAVSGRVETQDALRKFGESSRLQWRYLVTPLGDGLYRNAQCLSKGRPGTEMGDCLVREHGATLSMLNADVNHAHSGSRYDSIVETVGDRMRQIRKKRGLTLEAVGKIMGISASALSQIESGSTKDVKLPGFLKFCAYFAEDPYYVVFGKPNPPTGGRVRRIDLT